MVKAVLEKGAKFRTVRETFLESQVGRTPLIRLRRVTGNLPANVEIYAKAEHLNPGGPVNDRAALAMIRAGGCRGRLDTS